MSILNITNSKKLHNTIISKISHELSELSTDCYYPRISGVHNELLHQTGTNDKDLIKYSKLTYNNPKFKLLHDPKTTLIILISKHFIKDNDSAGGLSAMNALALRYYTNVMYKLIKHCNVDYFRGAKQHLSQNHLFNVKDTIGSSILHLSTEVFKRYKNDLLNDNHDKMLLMINELRSRIMQSAKSFADKYYKIYNSGEINQSKENESYFDSSMEAKINVLSDKISKDIAIYKHIDKEAIKIAQKITKFNKKYSIEYVKTLSNPKYSDNIKLAIYQFLKEMIEHKINNSEKINYIEFSKKLMGIKITKKTIYYKGIIISIHDDIIKDMNLVSWYNKLSVQSKATSKSYVSYYIVSTLANMIVSN